jgi:hypothetical protein
MKKLIFSVTVLVALTTAAFAAGNKSDKQMLKDLEQTVKNSTQVQWSTTDYYTKGSFSFNGKSASVFYSSDNSSLIGFSIHTVGNDLPAEVSAAIQKKYSDWKITDAIYFIDAYGNGSYFAQVEKGKNVLALKVSNGHTLIYSRMF